MAYIEKKKEGNKNIWVFKYCALYYWLMWPTIIVSIIAWVDKSSDVLNYIAGVLWILLILLAIPYWPSLFSLKRAMKEKGMQASGSKYSFSKPL